MKSLLLVAAFLCANTAFAASENNPAQSTSMRAEDVELDMDGPAWNLNLGVGNFNGGDMNVEGLKGNGLVLELQKRISDRVYLGASYSYYNTEYVVRDASTDLAKTKRGTTDVLGGSLEVHPIRMPLQKNSEFFASVFGGLATKLDQSSVFAQSALYFGAGLGINYNNQIGLRADLKSNREFASYSSLSLIGYY